MMEAAAALLVGLLAGMILALLAMYQAFKMRFEAQLDEKLRQTRDEVARETQRRSRAVIKGQIGERFAPFVDGFGYEPSDARFLGSPVDYVVFDGLADGQITGIAFVEVKTGAMRLSPFQEQVQEILKDSAIDFRIVQLPA